jgi:hypothetical protein
MPQNGEGLAPAARVRMLYVSGMPRQARVFRNVELGQLLRGGFAAHYAVCDKQIPQEGRVCTVPPTVF